ncbi:carboxylate--amine ligase [Streptomyces tsukubensis]|uniref:ATP-grasp domain-containing protein n=1 Tax=Streptomyces tsukubensis TaxID=83656 RepID=A0A1V4A465_9ACTN|nr:ATP-grasp domain-containing protein [Streptomyces tsukubensis]OON75367.1 ATP-grasp domain-containing protein [Streptomyces tsukubensis]QFR95004.1 ATP-grasp domain-containing protein [Streptomyces tsukubensis]
MSRLDTDVPAVLLRIDRNPFHHGTLGAARSLGRAGVAVHVVAEPGRSPVTRSRYVTATHRQPAPGAGHQEIGATLREVAAQVGERAVLIPMDDLGAVAAQRLPAPLAARFLQPDQPAGLCARVADKAELARVCAEAGIPHPPTELPGSAAEAVAGARRLGSPVIAKWTRPWLLPQGTGLRSTTVLRTAREAGELYARTAEAGSRLLLQEFLPQGPRLDWFFHGYADSGGGLAVSGAGLKERAWPPGAGLTAVGRWVPNPDIEETALRLVESLGYRGILDLDFRLDAATGAYHLLDFNPRPGAQFRLFTDPGGLDVVRALHLDLTGRAAPALTPVPERVFVVGNYALLSAAAAPRAARGHAPAPMGHGPGGAPSGGRERAWFAADDPAPALAMAVCFGLHLLRAAAGRLRRALARLRPGHRSPGRDAAPLTPSPRAPSPATPARAPETAAPRRTDDEKASSTSCTTWW